MVNDTFNGAIDKISSTGWIEGWALLNKNHFKAVSVCTLSKDKPIGVGVANLFRPDLLELGIGHGWHGFRVRFDGELDSQRTLKLSLVELNTSSLIAVAELPCPKMFTRTPVNIDSMLDDTDLEVTEISSLGLAEPAIDTFIARHGVEEFINRGYCYILGRPADTSGKTTYAPLIASGEMAPLTFLSTLFNSDERRQSKWAVLAPSDPGFIFAPEQSS